MDAGQDKYPGSTPIGWRVNAMLQNTRKMKQPLSIVVLDLSDLRSFKPSAWAKLGTWGYD